MKSITTLAREGYDVISALASDPHAFKQLAGVSLHGLGKMIFDSLSSAPTRQANEVMVEWLSGRSNPAPTWSLLLEVLRRLNLEGFSKSVEEYLRRYDGKYFC